MVIFMNDRDFPYAHLDQEELLDVMQPVHPVRNCFTPG